VYAALSLPPAIGLTLAFVSGWRRGWGPAARGVAWLAAAAALTAAALACYSLRDFQAQGRYLSLAMGAIAPLYGLGMEVAGGRRWAERLLAASAVAMLAVNLYIAAAIIPWYLAHG
jgi:hypothetical protein